MFPAPREVDRYLYRFGKNRTFGGLRFPSPLEVDRFLYALPEGTLAPMRYPFPAPLEVDRYLY